MESRSDFDVKRLGNHLDGKRVVILVSGGIASYKIPSLVRHFRQYGADVHVYLTEDAADFVSVKSLEWASRNPVVMDFTSNSEHLIENVDAYVFAPLTYNTLGKMAGGVADNVVTATFASALGRLEKGECSILIAPTMHGSMLNSVYDSNLNRLVSKGVKIISPEYGMGKANLPKSHVLVVKTIREICKGNLSGKNILLTAGPVPVEIDEVRVLTNVFKGRLGVAIAEELYLRGANVKLLIGPSRVVVPSYLDTTVVKNFEEYFKSVMAELNTGKYNFGIFSAAVSDYTPIKKTDGKIPSGGFLKSIELKPTFKVIQKVREAYPNLFMVTFKLESGISKKELTEIVKKRLDEGYDLVVANRKEDMIANHSAMIVDESGILAEPQTKQDIARSLSDVLEKKIS